MPKDEITEILYLLDKNIDGGNFYNSDGKEEHLSLQERKDIEYASNGSQKVKRSSV